MIPRSSIFSFETLRLRRRVPTATLLVVIVLTSAELLTRRAVAHHRLHLDASARQLIDQHLLEVETGRHDIWLMGNSTLGYGVDQHLLASRTRTTILKLPHGSATVEASAALLSYFLQHTKFLPTQVIIFLTMDDMNRSGYREEESKEYFRLCKNPLRKPQEMLLLWQTRGHLIDRFEKALDRLFHRGSRPKLKAESQNHFNGKIVANDEMYLRLLKNYEMDTSAIGHFAQVARRSGISNVTVVLVPCTDVYADFHDRHVHAMPYSRFRRELVDESNAEHVAFFDFGDPSSRYRNFFDGYHLNDEGAAAFTNRLIDEHVVVVH